MPQAGWRKKLVYEWIEKGYQTEVVDERKFNQWVVNAGLHITQLERNGDVLLFELRHREVL